MSGLLVRLDEMVEELVMIDTSEAGTVTKSATPFYS